jgi:hypothetical protein
LRDQFFEMLPPLRAAGVEPIAMRGLSSLLVGGAEPGRLLSDIDLLVPQGAREQTSAALAALGYEVFQGFHGPPNAITLGRSRDVGMVDLHTDIQPFHLRVDYDRIAQFCHRVNTPAGPVLLPSPTGAMLLLVLHDQLHDGDYWRGLIDARHFVDIAHLVRRGIDWQALHDFFPAGSPRNALEVQLRSARALLGLDIPDRYCGGLLAKVQLSRRRLQLRFPSAMRAFTLMSLALDPPQRSAGSTQRRRSASRVLRSKSARALGPVNPGKVVLRSS